MSQKMDTRRCHQHPINFSAVWILLILAACDAATGELCDVTSSQSAIILDLPESIGEQTDQATTPGELPLEGTPGEDIDLTLSKEGLDFFNLTGKKLQLLKPLDRDEKDLLTLRFTVVCRVVGSSSQRSIPVVVRVGDRNDNAPRFVGAPYSVTIPESTPVGATIFSDFSATDADAGANGQIRYSIVPGNGGPTDGVGLLSIPLPHQPHVVVARPLDYEMARVLVVNLQAADTSATNQQTSITTLTVVIQDSDDQDPQYVLSSCPSTPPSDGAVEGAPPLLSGGGCHSSPEFSASVVAGKRMGVMDVQPERIHAVDKDSMAAPIRYSLDSGTPESFRQFFSIDERSGALSQIAPVPRGLTGAFKINVKAEEQTPRRGSVSALLTVAVTNPDSAMPVVRASSLLGRVEENSALGTEVRTEDGQPVTLAVSDPDLLPGEKAPSYLFELTTGAFRVSPAGVLIVAVGGLDRDPPSPHTHTFQVVAREVSKEGTAGAASAPITVTVELLDANDHSPRFPVYPPVVVPAGARQHTLAQVHAQDPDEGSNGALQYELAAVTGGSGGHVPSGGRGQFVVDADTGEVRLVGEVQTGEQYSLHIKATDGGGLSGSTLLDVRVARGPNTGGPYFPRRRFASIVPEDTLPGTTIIKLKAVDPDGDVPRYSLHAMTPTDRPPATSREGGRRSLGGDGAVNASLPFQVDPLSGEVTLAAAVDRETKDQYHMIVTAEDDEGLRGSVTLDVTISDVNDERPQFQDLPYSFRVDEGREGALLGVVKATDIDEDRSGLVEYSVPEDAPLSVGPYNGTIYTKAALDYEKQQVYYVVVTATDGGRPPLSSTTTLTLLVGDMSDELPIFSQALYKVEVSEAVEAGSLVTSVKAEDPDSSPSVTYVLKSLGRESRLFSVHPDTGRVTVTAPLDREIAEEYILTIGTVENTGDGKGATCQVQVTLLDANDATPALSPLPPVLVSLETPPGAVLTTAEASDGDATAPFNKIRFELVTEEPVSEYLSIDQDSGAITLLKKLADLNVTEVQAEVVARDGGDPPRSSSTPLLLLVEVEGAPPPRIVLPPAFSRSQVFVTVKEDMAVGGMLARVGIINPPLHPLCALQEPSEHFKAVFTDSGDCGVQLISAVDAETLSDLNTVLTLELQTADEQYRTPNVTAKINITVEDVNDNPPRFLITEKVMNLTASPAEVEGGAGWGHGEEDAVTSSKPVLMRMKNGRGSENFMTIGPTTVLVTISEDIAVGKIVTELKATDRDSGTNGAVHYMLVPKSNRGGYFAVDPSTGILVTARSLTDVSQDLNPFNLTVQAQDSPVGRQPKTAELTVLVNVIGAAHRVVVPVSAQPVHLVARRQQMLDAIADREDAAVVLERIVAAPSLSSSPSSREVAHLSLPPSSEVWLALLDPHTGHLLPRTHPRVNRVLSQASDVPGSLRQQLLAAALGAETLQEQQVVHHSHAPPRRRPVPLGESVFGSTSLSDGGPERVIASFPGLQLGLVILAIVILVLGLFSILYVCVQWARAVRDRDKSAGLPILRVPILHHPAPSTITDTLHKQYEVQVLHMSVPLDDDSLKDVTPPRSAHNFFMDNVSYISKNNPMADDSRSDVGHPVLDVSSSPPWGVAPSTSGGGYPANSGMTIRSTNSGYHQHHRRDSSADESDDDITGVRPLSHSATNHNVLFGRRNDAAGSRGGRGAGGGSSSSTDSSSSPSHRPPSGHHRSHHQQQQPQVSTLEGRFRTHSNNYNGGGGSVHNTYTSEGGRRGASRGGINAGYRQDPEDDDGMIGYGFEGAGIGGPVAPILDLSPVQTTTLL